jgi:hypothetical protein
LRLRESRHSRENLQRAVAQLGRHAKARAPRRGGPPRHLGDRSLRHDTAAVQDQHARARVLDLAEEVRAEHHRRAALARDAVDQLKDLALSRRVESQRGLVEEDDLGIVHEGTRDTQPLPHPAAVGGDARVPALGQPHLLEQRCRGRTGARP